MIYNCACDVCAQMHDLHFDYNGSKTIAPEEKWPPTQN